MEKLLFSRPLRFPHDLALVSRKVKELTPGEEIFVSLKNAIDVEVVKAWCNDTGNEFKPAEGGIVIKRGKGFHGCGVGERLSFYLWGVRLHSAELLYRLTGNYPTYFFNFISVKEAFKGIKILSKSKNGFKLIPSPKEVEGYCGFAVGFEDLKSCEDSFVELLERGIGVEIVFKKEKKGFKIIKGAWDL